MEEFHATRVRCDYQWVYLVKAALNWFMAAKSRNKFARGGNCNMERDIRDTAIYSSSDYPEVRRQFATIFRKVGATLLSLYPCTISEY